MPYRRSVHRKDFDNRVGLLLKEAYKAQRRVKSVSSEHRDMIFQCAIFQTSAAIESYNRLIIESWIQKLRTKSISHIPVSARAFILVERLKGVIGKYNLLKDEAWVLSEISKSHWPWGLIMATGPTPPALNGAALHAHTSYPSEKNIERLYNRLGLSGMINKLGAEMKRDASILIESFQSVRTALAHSSPPPISITDVTRLLDDARILVAAIDRIMFRHIGKHGGVDCWT